MALCSSRRASLLQQDSTRLFQKLLRMFLNAIASLSTQPADVPYAITGVSLIYHLGYATVNIFKTVSLTISVWLACLL
jgi:hypothetical protein